MTPSVAAPGVTHPSDATGLILSGNGIFWCIPMHLFLKEFYSDNRRTFCNRMDCDGDTYYNTIL